MTTRHLECLHYLDIFVVNCMQINTETINNMLIFKSKIKYKKGLIYCKIQSNSTKACCHVMCRYYCIKDMPGKRIPKIWKFLYH